jgi:hypothetical protein
MSFPKDFEIYPFRINGFLLLLAAAACYWMVDANRATAGRGGRDLSGLLVEAVWLLAVGLGLIFHARWAAAVLVVFASLVAVFFAAGSFVALPISLLNMVFVAAILLVNVAFFRNRGLLGR